MSRGDFRLSAYHANVRRWMDANRQLIAEADRAIVRSALVLVAIGAAFLALFVVRPVP